MPRREQAILKRLRDFCLSLPDTSEATAWGHPNFKAGKKTFAAFENYRGQWVIAFKCEPGLQASLVAIDDRFFVSPYVGEHGWISMRVGRVFKWKETKALLRNSYRLVATRKMLEALGERGFEWQ